MRNFFSCLRKCGTVYTRFHMLEKKRRNSIELGNLISERQCELKANEPVSERSELASGYIKDLLFSEQSEISGKSGVYYIISWKFIALNNLKVFGAIITLKILGTIDILQIFGPLNGLFHFLRDEQSLSGNYIERKYFEVSVTKKLSKIGKRSNFKEKVVIDQKVFNIFEYI